MRRWKARRGSEQLMANLASGATSMANRVVPGGRHAVTGAEIAVNARARAGFSKVDALVRRHCSILSSRASCCKGAARHGACC